MSQKYVYSRHRVINYILYTYFWPTLYLFKLVNLIMLISCVTLLFNYKYTIKWIFLI